MKGRNEMKKIILFLLLFLLICCINKNQELNSKNSKKNEKSITERKEVGKKYMSYDEFNKKYFYWNGGNSFLRSDSNKLEKYILKKEENLESFINSDGSEVKMEKILGKFSSEEDRILQIIKLLIEAEIEERKTIQFSSFYFNNRFLDELRENRNKLLNNFYNSLFPFLLVSYKKYTLIMRYFLIVKFYLVLSRVAGILFGIIHSLSFPCV